MFGAFNTFGKLGSSAGSRSLLAQIQAMGAGFIGIPSLSNYQDSAGTTLVTQPGGGSADPPVGLAIDLSQGVALGPELVDTANTATAWAAYGSNSVADVDGAVTIAYVGGTNSVFGAKLTLSQAGGLSSDFTVGSTYEFTVSCKINTGSCTPYGNLGGANFILSPVASASFVSQTFRVVASAATGIFQINGDLGAGEVFSIKNISVRELKGHHATQSTSTARPKLSARVNLLTGTATLSTQSVTVAAGAHTIFWTGAGTVTASGAYAGALTSGQTFTATAGTLTLTVAGSVTSAQLNTGSTAMRYQAVVDASNYDYSGFPFAHVFDGVDDAHVITFPSSLGSACTVVTANRGTTPTIQTGQTIGTSHTISATHAGKLIFPRALTAAETATVTAWATRQGAL